MHACSGTPRADSRLPTAAARDVRADLLRGWAIIGVVAIHAAGLVLPAAAYFAVSYYFRWAVPIFICAYAFYGSRPVAPGGYGDSVRQRAWRLALPLVCYSLLYFLVLGDWRQPHWQGMQATLLRYLRGDGWAGQYFFLILLQLIVLLPWLARWRIRGWLLGLVLLLYSAGLQWLPLAWQHWPWLRAGGDRLLPYWLPYALLGVYLRQNEERWQAWTERLPAGAAGALLLLVPLWLSLNHDIDWPTGPYLLPAVPLVAAGVYVLHRRALASMASSRVAAPLAWLGRYSLVVFCLNPLFVHGLQQAWPADVRQVWAATLPLPLAALLALAVVLGICLLASLVGAWMRRFALLRSLAA
ncbi:acyltransferase [Corticibacter populi]|uniref:Acyltransferase n=1 Tax=Corticibacter populi TaxID=1550736 RepID=A0A3M6QZ41_9BURK|nr:acyltransferase [Corticibacter populi]RMX08296.1 acyltransferase [Corticibacter populi]RZS35578.1 fucose 4-O-acetylase-like acetyltransferase [Corticibacter populi]